MFPLPVLFEGHAAARDRTAVHAGAEARPGGDVRPAGEVEGRVRVGHEACGLAAGQQKGGVEQGPWSRERRTQTGERPPAGGDPG